VTAKIRHNTAVPLAAFVTLIGASAVATQRWWLMPILLIPAAMVWWGVRAGVDVDTESLRVRGMVGTRELPWSEVTGFRMARNRVNVTLANGNEVRLPAVTPTVLPAVIKASGQDLSAQ
jgi:hypothetical protein